MHTLIIGAGLAGVAAARALKAAGHEVLIIEARDRAGGRAYSRNFAGSKDVLDFGGAWITPWQKRIRALCTDYGIKLRPRHPVTDRRWFHDGRLDRKGPVFAPDAEAHSRALAALKKDAKRFAEAKPNDFGETSFAAYLDRLQAPAATRELFSAWWTASGNSDKSRASAAEFIASVSHGDGTPDGICIPWAETLEGGVQTLCERIISQDHLPVRFNAPIRAVAHGKAGVTVTLASGEQLTARTAILATGINVLNQIAFTPALAGARAEGRKLGHLGRCVKLWAKLGGVPVGILATGGGRGIEFMFTERLAADGATLAVGFGVAAKDWQPDFPKDAERAVARFMPEAKLLAWDWHDWNADPYARGAWVAGFAGNGAIHDSATWAPLGRLAFASSDIASADAGWFEAAIISGEEAATALMDLKG